MARKSNKTAHVLSLITKNKPPEELPMQNKATPPSPDHPVESEQTVIIVNSKIEDSLPLKIKENLIKFTEESSERNRQNLEPTIDSLPSKDQSKEPTVSEDKDTLKEIWSDKTTSEDLKNHEQSNTEIPTQIQNHTSKPVSDTAPLVVNTTSESHDHCPGNDDASTNEVDYCYTNVLEQIVKERVDEFLQKLGTCSCPRCKADTIALTLNNLPPKYIVANKDHVFPLINFYSNQYAVRVTAQLTKACITIKNSPHHA